MTPARPARARPSLEPWLLPPRLPKPPPPRRGEGALKVRGRREAGDRTMKGEGSMVLGWWWGFVSDGVRMLAMYGLLA